jgi:hypothetical protein
MSIEFTAVLIVGVPSSEIVTRTDVGCFIGSKEIGEIPTEYIMEAGLEFARCDSTEEDVYGKVVGITDSETPCANVDLAEAEAARIKVKEIFRTLRVDAEPRLLLVLQAV